MAGQSLKWAFALVVLAAPVGAVAADPGAANGAAAAAGTDAPPEKIAPNVSTTPGVYAPRPTPDANAIPAGAAPSHEAPANPPATDAPSPQSAPDAK
jgi:hypothetical protein